VMKNVLEKAAKELTLAQLAQEMVLGKTASDIYQEAKKITVLRHVGVIKSKVLKIPDWVYSGEKPEVEVAAEEVPAEQQESEIPAG